MVTSDVSLQAPAAAVERYLFYGVELNSPVFYTYPASQAEISRVCAALRDGFRVLTNRSCGLHVHIGNGDSGFDLKTLRGLAVMVWAFEGVLREVHPSWRTVGGWADSYAGGLDGTTLGRLSGEMERRMGLRVGGMGRMWGLEVLLACEDGNSVVELMAYQGAERGAVFFGNQMRPWRNEAKKTIEFRSHEGTLDADRIEAWMGVCEGLVRFARDSEKGELEEFCRRNVDRPVDGAADKGCSLWKVLMRIGCVREAELYEKRRRDSLVEEGGNKLEEMVKLIRPRDTGNFSKSGEVRPR